MDERYQDEHEVRYHIDRPARHENSFIIDAMALLERIPELAPRDTWPYLDGQVGQIEEEIEYDQALDGPPRLCSATGHKYT